MKEILNKIKGRHWVFILGIISMVISSIWSPVTANDIGTLLILAGFGIVLTGRG